MSARYLLRSLAYHTGALSLARLRQRDTLTAIMLHRVLDRADPDFASADPAWTLSLSLFEQLLDFVVRHYSVVSLGDVISAQEGVRPLPQRALLITFDDGWADNLRYAAPVLRRMGLPAVVFAVPAAIASPCHARMMLEPGDVQQLIEHGVAIGLHGYSHVPLTRVPDVAAELRLAREAVEALSGGKATISALGCPHGVYDDVVIDAARAQGIKHIFTSDPHLNATQGGMLDRTRTIGRINVVGRHIELARDELDPAGAARWLWARDVR